MSILVHISLGTYVKFLWSLYSQDCPHLSHKLAHCPSKWWYSLAQAINENFPFSSFSLLFGIFRLSSKSINILFSYLCSVAESCPTLNNPMNYSPPGSSVHGIFQARKLECRNVLPKRKGLAAEPASEGSAVGTAPKDTSKVPLGSPC